MSWREGLVRMGPGAALRTAHEQLLFTRRFLGLRCDVTSPRASPSAGITVSMTPRERDFDGFLRESRRASGSAWLELYVRQRMLEARVQTLYVAEDEHREPIYAQWLVTPATAGALHRFSPGRYPQLAADETLVEAAYTFTAFRGLGVMADGMSQLLDLAAAAGARAVITYVADDNVPSLRGCARVGFELDHVRVNRRRLGRRSSTVGAPDAHAVDAWGAAVER